MSPKSRSIYRGYTDNGIGLGVGFPIAYGEQYLQGTDASLTTPSFLRPLVPWLTLSVQASEKQLEAWSCFSQGDSVVIARLVSVENYKNRDAYFSHARVWEGQIPFDAAIYLGQSECFDNTQKDIGTASCLSPKDIIESWVNLLNNDSKKDIAINVIAHLYQALAQGYPLLIAARIDEFKAGSELFKYIAFARCALPATVKQPCNIRLFTRDLVANQDPPHLTLIPDDYTYQALQKLPNAALLNSQGKQQADRRGEWQLDARFEDYASYIVDLFCKKSHGLLPYSKFLQRDSLKQMLKEATDSEWVYPCYAAAWYLAHNFTQETANDLFSQMRDPGYSDYPWFKLLPAFTEDEWKKFPKKTLFDFVLENPDDLSEADKNLQSMLITSWQNLSLTFDDIFLADLDKYSKGIGRILALSSEKLLTEKAVSTIIIKVLINYYGDNNSENRRLQIIEEHNYISQGKFLDEYFIDHNLNDTNLRKRLLQLLSTKPELLKDKRKIANDTSEIPLSTWMESEIPLDQIITLLEIEVIHKSP